ncbi:MAG TPA: hypothetical protein EYP53_05825, partial [Candidatus Latescibacteria bacterium]|nr:hypothetical protein [Candidatus Latescibacterota bacterium]
MAICGRWGRFDRPSPARMKGEIIFEPKRPVRAGEWGSWRFVYTAKSKIPAGGGIDILFPFTSYCPIASWSIPQTESPLL